MQWRGERQQLSRSKLIIFGFPAHSLPLTPFLDTHQTHGTRLVLLLLTAHCELEHPKLSSCCSLERPVTLDWSVTLIVDADNIWIDTGDWRSSSSTVSVSCSQPKLLLLLLPRAGSDWRGPRSRGCFCHWSAPPLLTITHQHPTGSGPQWIKTPVDQLRPPTRSQGDPSSL